MNIEYVVLYKFMVKRKKSIEENLKELEDEIKTAVDPQEEIERKMEELIKLAEDGQFDKKVNTIKKSK